MASMFASSISIHAVDAVYRLASWNEIVLVDWHREPTHDRIVRLENVMRAVAYQESKATLFVRLRPHLGMPSAETRAELTQMFRDTESIITGWAVLLEGDGFWAATHRSVSATMHLLSGSRAKLRFFRTEHDAATYAAYLSGRHHPADVARFVSAVDQAAISA
jgi:hypothetical protein